MGVFINTYGSKNISLSDGEIANEVSKIFDLRPYFIEKRLKLRKPIYSETASYGHMGREPKITKKTFVNNLNKKITLDVELFTWEKLDFVKKIKKHFKNL